ncbi:energy transducer TonB [Novosphingobium malaysiense]|uniref:TonB C-terminal domain-containing protein n=1 Tax=Novosphingobium malaysiense TaxID=1348853 RepID=A0A0B1ZFY8_9SPHN|nr:energy transducer TonB [Novosphingobium malaysiense]KHK89420.1 hypothetical protein LK12_20025 [Novosphingobium malaysiense]
MSYVDGNSGSGRKALTGSTVALVQVGLAVALVHGLAVNFIESAPESRTEGVQIALPPPPPPKPVEEPKVLPKTQVPRETFIKSAEARVLPPLDIAPEPAVEPLGDKNLADFIFVPPVVPSDPPPPFAPKSARPTGTMAGWVTTDDYPTRDLRAGHSGTVRFRLAIDASGRVSECTIVQSSGYAGLDDATCRNVSRRARFEPATDAGGNQVAGTYAGTIRWVIPRD